MVSVSLTQALVRLHGAGRADTYGAALLDVAQDHLLWLLAELGYFDDHSLLFKGGTALRKCRLGGTGRFSTDLDFVAPDDDTVLSVCEAIDGATVAGFQFGLQSTRGDGRHWMMQVRHPDLGQPDVVASVEFARRPLILAPERCSFIELSVHRAYEIELPELPVIAGAEACAEKLARYRRVALGRDVYDLAQLASGVME
jgi:predicted nucleotidyltransferase component of viral defense system